MKLRAPARRLAAFRKSGTAVLKGPYNRGSYVNYGGIENRKVLASLELFAAKARLTLSA
jgi:hypothetical protein